MADGTLILDLHVVPGASKTAFAGEHDGRMRLRVAAPPVDGAANREVLRFLAKAYGVPRSAVTLVSGAGGRRKRVRIEGPGD